MLRFQHFWMMSHGLFARTMDNHHFTGKTHYKWPFSIAMSDCQSLPEGTKITNTPCEPPYATVPPRDSLIFGWPIAVSKVWQPADFRKASLSTMRILIGEI